MVPVFLYALHIVSKDPFYYKVKKNLPFICLVALFTLSCKTEPIDCSSSGPLISVYKVQDSECNKSNGYIKVSASGMGPFKFSFNGGHFTDKQEFDNLGPGNYNIAVMDSYGCIDQIEQEIVELNSFDIVVSSTISGCETNNGSLNITVKGGIPPYLFSLSNSLFRSKGNFTGLQAGEYEIFIRDSQGCEASIKHQVQSGVSWQNDIKPLIDTYCSVKNCHVPGGSSINFSDFGNVVSYASKIKISAQNKTMPPATEPELTIEEINLITCWVDDGAKNN